MTRWSSASVPGAPSDPLPTDPDWAGGSLYRPTAAHRRRLPRRAVAGHRGHRRRPRLVLVPARLAGPRPAGPGRRRRRPASRAARPGPVYVGETIDFWRVEERDPGVLLRLRAEMRLPGLAWLELSVEADPTTAGRSTYVQRAVFHPRGLLGHALLVGRRPVPRHRLRRDGPQHRHRRRAPDASPPASEPATSAAPSATPQRAQPWTLRMRSRASSWSTIGAG